MQLLAAKSARAEEARAAAAQLEAQLKADEEKLASLVSQEAGIEQEAKEAEVPENCCLD